MSTQPVSKHVQKQSSFCAEASVQSLHEASRRRDEIASLSLSKIAVNENDCDVLLTRCEEKSAESEERFRGQRNSPHRGRADRESTAHSRECLE